jgi:hypothetical protein
MTALEVSPSYRLQFADAINEYRLSSNHIQFRVGEGTWITLEPADVQMHFTLETEVAVWIRRIVTNGSRL